MFIPTDYTEITGLSESGTADDQGTWNEDIDLSQFLSIPSNATGILLYVGVYLSNDRWAGVRVSGKQTPHYLRDQNNRTAHRLFVPLNQNNTLDLYTEGSVKFYVAGFTDNDVSYFDVDAGFPETTGNSGNNQMSAATLPAEVPPSASAVIVPDRTEFGDRETESGPVYQDEDLRGSDNIIPAHNGEVWYDGFAELSISAYVKSGGYVWDKQAIALTDDDTWRDAPVSNANAAGVNVYGFELEGNFDIRRKGDSWDDLTPTKGARLQSRISGVDSDGTFQYKVHTDAVDASTEIGIVGWMMGEQNPSQLTTPGIPETTLNNADGTPSTGTAITRTITRVSDSLQLFTGSQTSDATTGELPAIDLSETDAAVDDVVEDSVSIDGATAPGVKSTTVLRTVGDLGA